MRTDDMKELETALKRQPSWEPPPGFATRVAVLAPRVSQEWPVRERRRNSVLRAAAAGLLTATIVYVVASIGSSIFPAMIRDTVSAVESYTTLAGIATHIMITRAMHVAWISAGLSLLFAASLALRARA